MGENLKKADEIKSQTDRPVSGNHHILVVDDEKEMCEVLQDVLTQAGYTTDAAGNGSEALELLDKNHYSMVLTDISMPDMNGFELIESIRGKYPSVKTLLVTSYDIEDHIRLALNHNVGSIFAKSFPFNFQEILFVIERIIREDFFGLKSYLQPGTEIKQEKIYRHKQIPAITDTIVSSFVKDGKSRRLKFSLTEILTNAFFYGGLNKNPEDRPAWDYDSVLPEDRAITVQYGMDKEKYGIAISDSSGNLTKKKYLHWINRQVTKGGDGKPLGITDAQGRGLYLTRQFVDRFILNIKKGELTEAVLLNYTKSSLNKQKPIWINEV
jgi:CheY-like chemotaxis protein